VNFLWNARAVALRSAGAFPLQTTLKLVCVKQIAAFQAAHLRRIGQLRTSAYLCFGRRRGLSLQPLVAGFDVALLFGWRPRGGRPGFDFGVFSILNSQRARSII
jgi:hypothetical protein